MNGIFKDFGKYWKKRNFFDKTCWLFLKAGECVRKVVVTLRSKRKWRTTEGEIFGEITCFSRLVWVSYETEATPVGTWIFSHLALQHKFKLGISSNLHKLLTRYGMTIDAFISRYLTNFRSKTYILSFSIFQSNTVIYDESDKENNFEWATDVASIV